MKKYSFLKDTDVLRVVENWTDAKGRIHWKQAAHELYIITGENVDSETVRSRYRFLTGRMGAYSEAAPKPAPEVEPEKPAQEPERPEAEVTDNQILNVLKAKRTAAQDAEMLHMEPDEFDNRVKALELSGMNIKRHASLVWLERVALEHGGDVVNDWNGERELTFAVVSDTHLCNQHQQITYLNDFYDRAAAAGVTTVYHAGDISDGYYKNRPDHIYELVKIGFDEQAEYIVEKYPRRPGIVTKFITGNHDATHIKNGGADIGKRIASLRDDMEYLGYMSAKIWLTPQCDMDLFHPLDGATYALSYSAQKFVDGLQGGQKPRLLFIGHHHKALYFPYRNIHVFEVPCFEGQTTFEKGKKINVNVGGWIIKIRVTPQGTISAIVPQLIPYYDMIEKDF